MRKHYAVVHFTCFEAPDDGSIEPDPVERRWLGYADGPSDARNKWVAEHRDNSFDGDIQRWSADQLGLDNLMIFRMPASPFDVPGLLSLVLRGGDPVAYVAAGR